MKEHFFSVVLPWSGIFLSIYLVYYAYRFQYAKQTLEKQLYKVYLPMFVLLEPFLYKKINEIGYNKIQEIIDELAIIVDRHYELVDPSVLHWCRLLKRRLNEPEYSLEQKEELYNHFCYLVDKEFEKTRRKMFLPTRGISYRLNNNQYRNKTEMTFAFLVVTVPPMLLFLAIAYLSYVFINWTDHLINR